MDPFLALQDDWYLQRIVSELENADTHNQLLLRQFAGKSGYEQSTGLEAYLRQSNPKANVLRGWPVYR